MSTYLKKIAVCLAAAAVAVCMCVLHGNAAWVEADKKEPLTDSEGTYLIGTAEELKWFADYVNAGSSDENTKAKLTANIVLNDCDVNAAVENGNTDGLIQWTPIGQYVSDSDKSKAFKGTFDGDGHTVSGIYINSADSFKGLFGFAEGAEIRNIGVINSSITGKNRVGGICGNSYQCTFINCYNLGKITSVGGASDTYDCGGICGRADDGMVTDCYNEGTISGVNSTGGICGAQNNNIISNCYNIGNINGTATNTAGICGFAGVDGSSKIKDCYNTGKIVGVKYVGGITGRHESTVIDAELILMNCYNEGYVSGEYDIGGICGYNYGGIIRNSYNTGEVTGSDNWYVGGICGYSDRGNVINVYNKGRVKTTGASGSVGGICGYSSGNIMNSYNIGVLTGTGSYAGGICGKNDVGGIIENSYNIGKITGGTTVGGICGNSPGGTIKNCHNASLDVIANGIAGASMGLIEDCSNISPVSGAGICGWNRSCGVIKNCINTRDSNASGPHSGGICGWNSGVIDECVNKGNIASTDTQVGGIAGRNGDGPNGTEPNAPKTIKNCYTIGSVSGTDYVGIICGVNFGSDDKISNCKYLSGLSGNVVGNGTATNISTISSVSDLPSLYTFPSIDYQTEITTKLNDWVRDNNSNGIYEGWAIVPGYNDGYPVLVPQTETVTEDDGTTAEYYLLYNPADMYWFANEVNSGNNSINGRLGIDIMFNPGYTFEFDEASGLVRVSFNGQDVCALGTGVTGIKYNTETAGERTKIYSSEALTNDNLESGTLPSDIVKWKPMGQHMSETSKNFKGKFDGGGHKVSGIYVYTVYYGGLFGRIYANSSISNVGIVNSYIGGYNSIGGICGYNEGGSINNCYNTAVITSDIYAGGICGENCDDGIISDGYNIGSITGDGYVGGICGANYSEISNSCNLGNVRGTDDNIGGICGYGGTVNSSYNIGSVTGNSSVGGICGWNNWKIISNCYNMGQLNGDSRVGGISGYNTSDAKINNNYNIGMVSGNENVGGISGDNGYGKILGNYNTGIVSGNINVGGICGLNSEKISNNYNTGIVFGGSNVGGISGYNKAIISNNYNVADVSGDDSVGGVCGKSDNENISNNFSLDSLNCVGSGSSEGTAYITTPERLLYDLNTWVDNNNSNNEYFYWISDLENENEGYPLLSGKTTAFKISWEIGRDTVQQSFVEGDMPKYFDGIPNRETDAQYTYTFKEWDKAFITVIGDETYTAVFDKTINQYTITWKSDDGKIWDTQTLEYGATPEYRGGEPTKAPDAQYTYTFKEWDKEFTPVIGDETYTAVFDRTINEYTITWDIDGVKTTEQYNYGEMPAHETPAKAPDAQYTYTFSGWMPTLTEVTGNTTYKAVFDGTINKYTITWDINGVKTTEQYNYGEMPAHEIPTKAPDAQYTYTFKEWDKEFTPVIGDETYTAVFDKTINQYTITWKSDDGKVWDTQTLEYGATPEYRGGEPTKAPDAQYTYTFKEWDKEFTPVIGDETYTAVFDKTINQYTITWKSDDGKVWDTQTLEYGATPEYRGGEPTKAPDAQYTYTFAGWTPEVTEVTGDVIYIAEFTKQGTEHNITILGTIPHGTVSIEGDTAGYGSVVTLTIKPDEGYELGALTIKFGEKDIEVKYDYDIISFTMPAGDVTIDALFKPENGDWFTEEEKEYKITEEDQLNSMAYIAESNQSVNGFKDYTFTLQEDLNYTAEKSIDAFNGTFDGNGHSVILSGLPLFAEIGTEGEVKNTSFEGTLDGNGCDYLGAAANINNGKIINCRVDADLKNAKCIGGIAGWNTGSVINCLSDADVKSSTAEKSGGVCGDNSGKISICAFSGNFDNMSSDKFASIVFTNVDKGTISDCYYIITDVESLNAPTAVGNRSKNSGAMCYTVKDGVKLTTGMVMSKRVAVLLNNAVDASGDGELLKWKENAIKETNIPGELSIFASEKIQTPKEEVLIENVDEYEKQKNEDLDSSDETKGEEYAVLTYAAHVEDYGWLEFVGEGETAGTVGEARRLEAVKIAVDTNLEGSIEYRTHVQDLDWQDFVCDGEVSGTEGQALRAEAVEIRLTGELAEKYSVKYRAHVQDEGWQDWKYDGGMAGTTGQSIRMEAIEIYLIEKGDYVITEEEPEVEQSEPEVEQSAEYEEEPADAEIEEIYASLTYAAHVEDYGWLDFVNEGETAGTTGQSLRLEGLKIVVDSNLEGSIEYRTHVQDIDWQDFVCDGELSGTEGQALRAEAVEIRLTGELAEKYSVKYRAHVQDEGWQDWKYDGEMAGTTGQSLRLEAIEIALVEK